MLKGVKNHLLHNDASCLEPSGQRIGINICWTPDTFSTSFYNSNSKQPYGTGTGNVPILQMMKPRLGGVQKLAKVTSAKWCSGDLLVSRACVLSSALRSFLCELFCKAELG